MDIKQEDNGKKGLFRALVNGEEAGLMTYTWAGDHKFIIDHTEVNAEFSGQGIGKNLVMAAVGFARENGFKVLPLCPYAKSVFEKTKAIQDVLF
ncbi:GNAT family N-acetyltransferase [Parapedobacter sp. 10938]|uniref:GNAT family N-acetyltransferase n=1 Tax=Parapedobacter flavus TaxID=3110225 RepID=UPI002DB7A50B|nr:GNAT family N-acetyltransferase [Parapedobacter sp. 10938]MEC3878564.1 GNAT family N-acetyltransferase [Parapedobacter sp. 10938]